MPAAAEAPPRYVIVTVGSTGDMYPFLRLATALQALGRQVTMLAPIVHADLMRQTGLHCISLGTVEEYQRVIGNPDLWNPRKAFGVLFSDYRSHLATSLQALRAQLTGGERCVVIAHPFVLPAVALARETGSRCHIVGTFLAPSNLRTAHDPLQVGPLAIPRWVPMAWRQALWRHIDRRMVDPIAVPEVNAARAALGLAPIDHFLAHMASIPDLTLTLFPDWFGPPCPDWPAPLCMGDFPLYEPPPTPTSTSPPTPTSPLSQALPAELARFLAAGTAPIVFTPGTGNIHAAALFRGAVQATQALGRRAIFLTRQRDQVPADLPTSILWQPFVSMQALLPHAAALVHHGGIGTTAEALRAGVPQLVTPYAWDQFDNAARVTALGVGAALPAARLRARGLTRHLRQILASEPVRMACRATAARFDERVDAQALCLKVERQLGLAGG